MIIKHTDIVFIVIYIINLKIYYIFFYKIMDEQILDRMNNICIDDLDSIQFYKSKIDIKYDDIINIWKSYIEKRYMDKKNIVNFDDSKTNSILKISILENVLGIILEEVFKKQINDIEDDLLIFYFKGEKNILLLYKSYFPLLNENKIMLPFWQYILESKKLLKQINKMFRDNENLCIMTYTLKF